MVTALPGAESKNRSIDSVFLIFKGVVKSDLLFSLSVSAVARDSSSRVFGVSKLFEARDYDANKDIVEELTIAY
jgi:hypothetical protein